MKEDNLVKIVGVVSIGNIWFFNLSLSESDDDNRLFMLLDEKTTLTEIDNQWGQIEKDRKEFYKRFGGFLSDYGDELEVYRFSTWHKLGLSWKRLTQYINFEAAIHLLQAHQTEFLLTKILGQHRLKILFEIFNKEKIFDSKISQGIENIDKGFPPWNFNDDPFSKGVIREKIRYFDKRLKERSIDVGDSTRGFLNSFDIFHMPLNNIGYYSGRDFLNNICDLFDEKLPDLWTENKDWISEWIDKIASIDKGVKERSIE